MELKYQFGSSRFVTLNIHKYHDQLPNSTQFEQKMYDL